ncbi:MAG: PAC2 family protein [Candidatus Latescibacteria bacterium]|nr:PAC2 family protein [Candidatus Latescibacterota bacterium]
MQVNMLEELPDSFQAQVMVASWPGMGNVGIGAVDYIRRKLQAVAFAEVDMRSYFTAEAVMVEDGIATFPPSPTHIFYAVEKHNLILFQSEAQIGGTPGDDLMHQILDVGQRFGIQSIFTAASYNMPISHKDGTQVLGVANNAAFRDSLVPSGIEILKEGYVSGLNGLLLGFASHRDMDAACLLGTMPHYAQAIPNPKVSREIVLTLGRILNFEVDMNEIDDAAEKMEDTMEEIEEQIQKAFSHMEDIPEGDLPLGKIEEDKVPQYAMERIEKLFQEILRSVSQGQFQQKANELKKELDQWNLYQFYEDRFLDLFKSDTEGGG